MLVGVPLSSKAFTLVTPSRLVGGTVATWESERIRPGGRRWPGMNPPFHFSVMNSQLDNSNEAPSALSFPGGAELLTSAFAALDETDQYDAVLTGLCAKILDTGKVEDMAEAAVSPLGVMEQPLKLLGEMNLRKVPASPRSLSALIDTAATTENVRIMKLTLSMCIKNSSSSLVAQYGALQATIRQLPSANSPIRKGKQEVLPEIPTDDRVKELSSATLFVGVLSGCFLVKGLVPLLWDRNGDLYFYTNILPDLISTTLLAGILVDNFYDAIQTFFKVVPILPKKWEIPAKEDVPFGIGKGEYTKSIVAGLTRLTTVDTERQCESEAAALFAAYSLGLPCFAFQPNALEAAIMMFESVKVRDGDTGGVVA